MKQKLKIRFTYMLPLIALPIYMFMVFLVKNDAMNNSIDENDLMAHAIAFIVIGITAFIGWFSLQLLSIYQYGLFDSIYTTIAFAVIIHYSILGLLIDAFIYWKKIREDKFDEQYKELEDAFKNYNKNIIEN